MKYDTDTASRGWKAFISHTAMECCLSKELKLMSNNNQASNFDTVLGILIGTYWAACLILYLGSRPKFTSDSCEQLRLWRGVSACHQLASDYIIDLEVNS